MFVRSFFLQTAFCCFWKCLSICFSFKLYVAGCNVCPFVFLLTAFAFFFEKFVDSFFEARLLKTACCLFFFEMFVPLFFPKTTFVCISKFLSARLYTYINKCVLKKHTITKYLMQIGLFPVSDRSASAASFEQGCTKLQCLKFKFECL